MNVTELSAFILFSFGVLCSGDECDKGVRLEPQGAVTTRGSKVRFTCSISQCVTTNYPDTKFWMEHNGIAFGEETKTQENKNDFSFAFFEKHFNSPSDAGKYTCKVEDQHTLQTGVDVRFVHSEDRPTIVRLKNGTNTISCLGDSIESRDLVMAWDNPTKSCDRSENTTTVELKSLKEVDSLRECYVTSTKACTHYGNVANATLVQAGVIYRKYLLVVEIKQERTGNLINVTALVFGPRASIVETSWEINGTTISGRNQNVSDNQTVTGVIVNDTVRVLQLVHRLGGSELGWENVLLEEKQGTNDAATLSGSTIAGICIVIVAVLLFS